MYLYDFTSEERQRLAELQQSYLKRINALDIREQKEVVEEMAAKMHDLYETIADERFQVICEQGIDAIMESAFREIDHAIDRVYKTYCDLYNRRDDENIARMFFASATLTDSGFLLNAQHLTVTVETEVMRHINEVGSTGDYRQRIFDYLDQAIANCPFVAKNDDEVMTATIPEKSPDNDYYSIGLINRVTPLDLFSDELFLDSGRFSSGLVPLDISRRKSKTPIWMHGAIDFTDAMKEALRQGIDKFTTGLTNDDKLVHEAIISHYMGGNFVLSDKMIYRAITGITTDDITVPEEWTRIIREALVKFKATITIRYERLSKEGKQWLEIPTPIISWLPATHGAYINGGYSENVIILSRDAERMPPLLRWAIFNGNELDTRDITLLNIPGLNWTKQNRTLERALYDRLIRMSNETKRRNSGEIPLNRRTIRLDYLYSFIDYDGGDIDKLRKDGKPIERKSETALSYTGKNKRRNVKDQITKCLKHWEKKGLITGYRFIQEGKQGYTKIVFTFTSKGAEALKAEK